MIFVTGDTHGEWYDLRERMISIGDSNTKSFLLILGDFGFIFDTRRNKILEEIKKLKKMSRLAEDLNMDILFLDGNHENFPRLNLLDQVEKFGNVCGKVFDNIYHLKRGNIYTIEDKKFFVFGGADSIDRSHRIMNVDWWQEEVPNRIEFENGMINLDRSKWNVDYILSHTIHNEILKDLDGVKYLYQNSLDKYFDMISTEVEFTHWYFGHMHQNKRINNKYTSLYEEVIKI